MFTSVDPLVTMTMQPYIYGAANPVRYSDPSGLCPFSGCWEQFDRVLLEAAGKVDPGYARRREFEVNSDIADSILDGYGSSFSDGNQRYTQADLHWARELNCNAFVSCDTAPLTWRSFVGLGKGVLVGGAAVAAAGFCPATAGLTCVLLAGASAGAASNVILSEGEDCINGSSCGEYSVGEVADDAFDGALVGAGAGVAGRGMAIAVGSNRGSVGFWGVWSRQGWSDAVDGIASTAGVRGYIWSIRQYVAISVNYLKGLLTE